MNQLKLQVNACSWPEAGKNVNERVGALHMLDAQKFHYYGVTIIAWKESLLFCS